MVDTSKTLWVGIGCYDGCRWDAMGRTKTVVVDTSKILCVGMVIMGEELL